MSWLKMTSEALFLMKGGTNQFLDKIDLEIHGDPANQEYKLNVPTQWLEGSDVPRAIVIDVGSTERPSPATKGFDADEIYSKIVKRSDWNASPPVSRFEIIDRPAFIVIHHTETPPSSGGLDQAKEVVKGIQKFHMAPEPQGRGWSDIGYNFLNTVNGILFEGRSGSLAEAIKGNTVRGAHARTDAGNRSPGVASEGDFTTKAMNPEQWNSLVNICAALCQSCNIEPTRIRGHRDFVPTVCPGDWLYNRLEQLQKEVAQKLAS